MADATPTAAAFDIEQPACFYLGREYDLDSRAVLPDKYVMYDARDLTTHGVVVGMTGSGKTGLCISLLEEAAIDGIPCVIIDPKGDLTNLLLAVPRPRPEPVSGVAQRGRRPPEGTVAGAIRRANWPTAGARDWRTRTRRRNASPGCKASSDWRIYTPGSEAGLPLSILGTFAAPKAKMPREELTQKIDATATRPARPDRHHRRPGAVARTHPHFATRCCNAWEARPRPRPAAADPRRSRSRRSAPSAPTTWKPSSPPKDRLKFASTLNNVLASPSFSTWTMGEPLDLATMLYRDGQPQQLIFYIAHLDDTQRMFFTTLLLEEVLSWTRRQPGTTNLRALLYFDEVFGYLPPHPANPPSKGPLLTLLKQARAFGVGVLLATQNPVDLDYKALSNAGTWFVGKLQTERDKARLLDGLESAAAEHGTLTRPGLSGESHLVAGQPHLPAARHPSAEAGVVPEPLGAVVSARADDARAGVPADGAAEGRQADGAAGWPFRCASPAARTSGRT